MRLSELYLGGCSDLTGVRLRELADLATLTELDLEDCFKLTRTWGGARDARLGGARRGCECKRNAHGVRSARTVPAPREQCTHRYSGDLGSC